MESGEDEGQNQEEPVFYSKAKTYWSNVSPTINGVLGGYGFISSCDIQGSEEFLTKLFQVFCLFPLNDFSMTHDFSYKL